MGPTEVLMEQDLTSVIMPPPHPKDVGSPSDWARVERDLRVTYPSDFKRINRTYGTGWFDGFIRVFGPISQRLGYSLGQYDGDPELDLEILRQGMPTLAERVGSCRRVPIALTRNGDEISYVVNDSGNVGGVLLVESRAASFELIEREFSRVLCDWLQGTLRTPAFPGNFPSAYPEFEVG